MLVSGRRPNNGIPLLPAPPMNPIWLKGKAPYLALGALFRNA